MRTMRPFMRFSTGVDWRHRHLVSEHKFPEIYGVYFTGSYSLDYSAVRHSLHYYLLLIGVDGQIVTIVTNPAGTPVDGQPGTFDYPILITITLMCMATAADGSSPVTVTSYEWTADGCYTRSGGVLDPCFYSLPSATGQNTTGINVLAPNAGTVTCTATIDGMDYTSDPLTLRISGEQL